MLKNEYQYALMFYGEGQRVLGQVSVELDWEPAREWAEFMAVRRGLTAARAAGGTFTVWPVWHTTLGEPYVKGFRIGVEREGAAEVSTDFGTAFFKGFAKQAAAAMVGRGLLKKGDRLKYVTAAFPRQQEPGDAPAFRFTTEEVAPEWELSESPLVGFERGSVLQGEVGSEDMPVFVPQRILDEAAALSKAAGAKETGGVLIGRLHRDAGAPEVFAEVTAQIHARHTEANLTKLTFTPATWTEVRATLELRRRGEIMLGWWHSHPLREWCKGCSAESRKSCSMGKDFFSAHDHALHRTVFPRAYSVALVVNDLAGDDVTFSLFGWRRGLLEPRGFHVRDEATADREAKNSVRAEPTACVT